MERVLTSMTILLFSTSASAQAPASLTPDDRSAIQELAGSYARTLAECDAEAYAELFVPDTGFFASGFRGQIVGHERLVALVESERHCIAPAGASSTALPRSANVPTVVVDITPAGVLGVADLGAAGQYQDEFVKTPQGWRFASRTVVIPAERDAGLDASEMLAIRRLSDPELGDHYAADQNGIQRLRSSGVTLGVADGKVTGRVYLKDGSCYDDVYEQTGPGEWRIQSRVHVPAATTTGQALLPRTL